MTKNPALYSTIPARLAVVLLSCGVVEITCAEEKSDYGALGAHFRSFYFNRDKEQNNPDSVALTQALMLRYSSTYFRDFVGLNASWFGNLKLIGEDGKGGTGLLQDLDDGSQKSYGKLAEVFVKFNLPYGSSMDVGRMALLTPLLNDPDYRATPTTTQAGIFKIGTKKTSAYAVASDKGSAYTESDFSPYTDSNGDQFNIYAVGIRHKSDNGLFVHGATAYADNVLNQSYLNTKYILHIKNDLNLLFDGYLYHGRANGEGALTGIGADYSSNLANAAMQLAGLNSKWTLSYQSVNGDSYQTSWDGGVHDDTSFLSWQSVQRLNFDRGGENSWQFRFDYDFKNYVNGLSAMARYISGDDIERQDDLSGSEWERDIDFIYSPPGIKDLTFRWRYAVVRSSETYDSDEHRLIINYKINPF